MSMKSGLRAAAKLGIPTSAIQLGPRGGRFYVTASGKKVYGEPPKPHEQQAHAPQIEMSRVKERKLVPDHVKVGGKVLADLDEEGWVAGTVTSVSKARGVARIRLHDGSGDIEAPFEATKPHSSQPHQPTPKPPAPPKPPKTSGVGKGPKGGPGPHIKPGGKVEVDLEGEGWIRGTISEVKGKHAYVELADGTTAKAPIDSIRAHRGKEEGKVGIDRYVRGEVRGNPMFKYQIAEAISSGGFGPLLEKHPLVDFHEGGTGSSSYLGVYRRGGGDDPRPNIAIKADMRGYTDRVRARGVWGDSSPHGRHTELVLPGAPKDFTVEQAHHGTILHEVAHHLHLHDAVWHHGWGDTFPNSKSADWDRRLHDHYRKVKNDDRHWAPSKYSLDNHKEWFAEAFVAYMYHNAEFKRLDPHGYELVRERRIMAGMRP